MQYLALLVRAGSDHGSVESYLVCYPDVRIKYTIQDHMPGALHTLSIVFDVLTVRRTSGNTGTRF